MAPSHMTLDQIIDADSVSSPGAVEDLLGDAYLISTNNVYASVRKVVLSAGYRLIAEVNDELWQDYQCVSLLCLDRIIKSRCLPYSRTKLILKRLYLGHGSMRIDPDFLIMSVAGTNLFHESCHAVGYLALQRSPALASKLASSDADLFVWGALITEAIANTAELIAWMDALVVWDKIFLRLNTSSAYEDSDLRSIVNHARQMLGDRAVFSSVFLSFLTARLYADVSTPHRQTFIQNTLQLSHDTAKHPSLFLLLGRIGRWLRPEYREIVAPTYFRFYGKEEAFESLRAHRNALEVAPEELLRYSEFCSDAMHGLDVACV